MRNWICSPSPPSTTALVVASASPAVARANCSSVSGFMCPSSRLFGRPWPVATLGASPLPCPDPNENAVAHVSAGRPARTGRRRRSGATAAAEREVGERADEIHERGRYPHRLGSVDPGTRTPRQVGERRAEERELHEPGTENRGPLLSGEVVPALLAAVRHVASLRSRRRGRV